MSDGFSRGSACVGENTFSPFMDHVNWWSADGIFEITIGFGSMSFAQAKVVDIVWDLVGFKLPLALAPWTTPDGVTGELTARACPSHPDRRTGRPIRHVLHNLEGPGNVRCRLLGPTARRVLYILDGVPPTGSVPRDNIPAPSRLSFRPGSSTQDSHGLYHLLAFPRHFFPYRCQRHDRLFAQNRSLYPRQF